MNIKEKFPEEIQQIEDSLLTYFANHKRFAHPGFEKLLFSVNYSLETEGKRFRPLLSLLVAKALGKSYEVIKPVAIAVEFIHTYSLIHDDLPCMDDDDERRGRPSNHKKFGEDIALLAGDALLTESFFALSNGFSDKPVIATKTIQQVSEAAGLLGMVGGQAMDIVIPESGQSEQHMQWVHQLKTGCLIKVAVTAAAIASDADETQLKFLTELGEKLGQAFQVADDIDDFEPDNPEPTNICSTRGLEFAKTQLETLTAEITEICNSLNSPELFWLADFNQKRVFN